ncbi:MAG: hypothetical protein NWF01_06880 [Candidatus Bathyarchaeota archaeon]|nr:hypothetical protein [Candidatus Bathyarchaeota archaeon]
MNNKKISVIASLLLLTTLFVISAMPTRAQESAVLPVSITILSPEGSGTTDPAPGDYNFTDIYTLTATPADGWEFSHWIVTGDLAQQLGITTTAISVTDNPVVGDCGFGYSYQYQPIFVETSNTSASLPDVPVLYVVIIVVAVAILAGAGAFLAGKKSK